MSEMVERVAKALFEDDRGGTGGVSWADLIAASKKPTSNAHVILVPFRRRARAAIAAMREPTHKMQWQMERSTELAYLGFCGPLEVYQRMIDTALTDELNPPNLP